MADFYGFLRPLQDVPSIPSIEESSNRQEALPPIELHFFRIPTVHMYMYVLHSPPAMCVNANP